MTMTDEQVAALMQTWRDALAKQMDEMKLRQWCVERAIQSGNAANAEGFFRFITAPFAETFKDEKSP